MIETKTLEKQKQLLDFKYIGETYNEDDLIDAYLSGKSVGENEYETKLKSHIYNGLQSAALTANLFKERLNTISIQVIDMYLRITGVDEFECLAIMQEKDYYNKDKRWKSYEVSKVINNAVSEFNLSFSLIPFSEELRTDVITSDGFYFKYNNGE